MANIFDIFKPDEEEALKKNDASFDASMPIGLPAASAQSSQPVSAPMSKNLDIGSILASVQPKGAPAMSPLTPPANQAPNVPENKQVVPSIISDYDRISNDQNKAIANTEADAGKKNMMLGLAKIFANQASTESILRGNKAPDLSNFDNLMKAQQQRVTEAKSGKEAALGELLKKFNLGNTVEDRARADKRFEQEQTENGYKNTALANNAEMLKADSAISNQLRGTAKQALTLQASRAAQLGKKDVAAQLIAQRDQLDGLNGEQINALLKTNGAIDFGAEMKMAHDDRMMAAADKKQSGKDAQRKQEMTASVRKEITGLPAYKDLQDLDRQFSTMSKIYENPNSVSDEAFIVNFQKMLDPGSVVREGEFSRTREGAGLIAKLEMAIQQARGNGRVSPEMRKSILDTSKAIRDGAHNYFEKTALAPYKQYMDAYQIPVDQVVNMGVYTPENTSGAQPTVIKSVKDLPPIN